MPCCHVHISRQYLVALQVYVTMVQCMLSWCIACNGVRMCPLSLQVEDLSSKAVASVESSIQRYKDQRAKQYEVLM